MSEGAQLLVAAATLVSAIASFVMAWRGQMSSQKTHDLVNGQSEAWRAVREEQGRQIGLVQGATQERDRPHSK